MTDAAMLIRDIVDNHHAYLRRVFPELDRRLGALCERGSGWDALRGTFGELRGDLESHMLKEERILFPMIEQCAARGEGLPFEGPVLQMLSEHRLAERLLESLREEAGRRKQDGLAASPEARGALELLAGLEDDLREHIRKEEEELFPTVRPQARRAGA